MAKETNQPRKRTMGCKDVPARRPVTEGGGKPMMAGTSILIGGEAVTTVSFKGDPQRQIDQRVQKSGRAVPGHIAVFDDAYGSKLRDGGYTAEELLGGGSGGGITPHIGENGNWYIGDTDTGVRAHGSDGIDGQHGAPGAPGKSAYQSYLDNGGTLSEAQWVASMVQTKAPEIVDSIEEMVDTTKVYVLRTDGMIYAYKETTVSVPGGEPQFTNVLDGASISLNKRFSSSSNAPSDANGYALVDYIPVKYGDVLRFKSPGGAQGTDYNGVHSGAKLLAGNHSRIIFCNSDASSNNICNGKYARPLTTYEVITDASGVSSFIVGYYNATADDYTTNQAAADANEITKMMMVLYFSDASIDASALEGAIVTINQEIKYSEASETTTQAWESTGLAYAPGDYEARVVDLENDVASLEGAVVELQEEAAQGGATTSETLDYSYFEGLTEKGRYNTAGVFEGTVSWRATPLLPVSPGDTLEVKLATFEGVSAISYFDEYGNFIGYVAGAATTAENKYPLTGVQTVPTGVCFCKLSVFLSAGYTDQSVTVTRNVTEGLKTTLRVASGKPLNVLVLGDSYSEMGLWVRSMTDVIRVGSLVNLAKTSATIRDKYADRVTYPYLDRPSNNGANGNTLGCQIQKLKRLMAGSDLDTGEVQIYTEASQYPDVIIIEGGMNDAPDSDEKVATYYDQFLTAKTAYYKVSSGATATQTTVYVKPSLDTVDRTSFAGAYRYACEELLALFPQAQIFITTASHMNYFAADPNVLYGKIAAQQRKCAEIMSYTVIDWHAEGNLNTMMVGLNGSGTQADPYTPVGGDAYTTDLLHPNAEGAKRYGRLAGRVIAQRYMGVR